MKISIILGTRPEIMINGAYLSLRVKSFYRKSLIIDIMKNCIMNWRYISGMK